MCIDSPYQSRWPHNLLSKHLTFRKCRVARNSGESVSWAFAHCSANGVRASRHSWQTSELILIMKVKEQMQVDSLDILKTKNYSYYHMECISRSECRKAIAEQCVFTELSERRLPRFWSDPQVFGVCDWRLPASFWLWGTHW